jgi:hypothetical protein
VLFEGWQKCTCTYADDVIYSLGRSVEWFCFLIYSVFSGISSVRFLFDGQDKMNLSSGSRSLGVSQPVLNALLRRPGHCASRCDSNMSLDS